ncbi:hypothetical protein Tco_1499740 [Tanacetum coccineum]
MTPRSCLRWKPTGKIIKTVGLRCVPTGKIFTFSTTKVDSQPTNGSNKDITNQYECEQTLDVSAGNLNLSVGTNDGVAASFQQRFPMIVKIAVLVFNPPITWSPIKIPSDESKILRIKNEAKMAGFRTCPRQRHVVPRGCHVSLHVSKWVLLANGADDVATTYELRLVRCCKSGKVEKVSLFRLEIFINMSSIVKDVITNGSWSWPNAWLVKYPYLFSITTPTLVPNAMHQLTWKALNDVYTTFSVATIWDCIRPRGNKIDWYNLIWDHLKIYARISNASSLLDLIVDFHTSLSRKRSARSVFPKLVFSCYFIWQEWNYRLFFRRDQKIKLLM